MKELLSKIGINASGYFSDDNNYVIDLESSEEFNRVFSKLDRSDLIEENEDSSVANFNVSNVMYSNEEYSLNLIADFDQDQYKLVVTKLGDE